MIDSMDLRDQQRLTIEDARKSIENEARFVIQSVRYLLEEGYVDPLTPVAELLSFYEELIP